MIAPKRVWDWPVRLTHWLLAPLIAFSWWSAEIQRLDWHRLSGYLVLTLVIFRLLWGFVGSETARFDAFLRGPRAVVAYLRGQAARGIGHNPLGGWAVIAMILALAVQVGLGLFAVDVDGLESGPFAVFMSFDAGRAAAELHEWTFNAFVLLIALHLCAIAFYAVVQKKNLVGPMITGRQMSEVAAPRLAPHWRALLCFGIAGAATFATSQSFWAF
ncbi:MAG: cytochrome b/b6 domain-containing protein [Hyphomonadaceae bacterium]|nr:cytochrome b/b6 domain-containing protein [Hyphomonadaceae bacterium]